MSRAHERPHSYLSYLECPRCGRRLDADQPQNLCPLWHASPPSPGWAGPGWHRGATDCRCGSPLLARYDLERLQHDLAKEDLQGRPRGMWRYAEFLPVRDARNVVTLGEGGTPMSLARRLGQVVGLPSLYVKDEGLNPTGTFKARGASAGISRARELGIRAVAMPTAGNAGGAWAAYGAHAGIAVHVAMPRDAPAVTQVECQLYGAHLTLVDGLISDAGQLISAGIREHGWFDVSTLKEPYRIEGKKTMGLEIAEGFGWELPDVIVYPAGGGVGIIGIWKALQELAAIGWVRRPLPRMVIVQAAGCAPLVKAFHEGWEESTFWEGAHTVAAGLRVPKALGDFLVLRALRESGGTAVAVEDQAILEAMRLLARTEGLWACPEGAATLAGTLALRSEGWLHPKDRVVLINTGTGLKYPDLSTSSE